MSSEDSAGFFLEILINLEKLLLSQIKFIWWGKKITMGWPYTDVFYLEHEINEHNGKTSKLLINNNFFCVRLKINYWEIYICAILWNSEGVLGTLGLVVTGVSCDSGK